MIEKKNWWISWSETQVFIVGDSYKRGNALNKKSCEEWGSFVNDDDWL